MNKLLSGEAWTKLLGIEIIDPTGWTSKSDYTDRLISKSEFCNRAASSVLKTKIAATRREASKMLGGFNQRKDL